MTAREKLTKTKVAVVEYLATHDIVEKLNKTVNELAKTRPADPFAFLADVLSDYRLHNDTPLIDRVQLRFTLPQSYHFDISGGSRPLLSSSTRVSSSILCSNSPCISATLFGRVSSTRAAREMSATKWCHPRCLPDSISVRDSSVSKSKSAGGEEVSSMTTATSTSTTSTGSKTTGITGASEITVEPSCFVASLLSEDPLQLTESVTRVVLPALRRFRMHENKAIDLTLQQIYENHFESSDRYRIELRLPKVGLSGGGSSSSSSSSTTTTTTMSSTEEKSVTSDDTSKVELVRTPRDGVIRPMKLALFHLSLLVSKSAAQFMNLPLYQYILRYVSPVVKPPGLDGEDTPTISRARSLVASDSINNRMPNLAMLVFECSVLPTVYLIVNPATVANPLKIVGLLQTASLVMKSVFGSDEYSGMNTMDSLFSSLKVAMESLRAVVSAVNDEFGSLVDSDPVLFQYYLSFDGVEIQSPELIASKKDWLTYLLDKVGLLNGTSADGSAAESNAGLIAFIQEVKGPLHNSVDGTTADDDLFLEMAEWSNQFRSRGVKLLASVPNEVGGADIRSSDGLYGSVLSVMDARTVSGLLCDAMICHSQPCPSVRPLEEQRVIVMDHSLDGFCLDDSLVDLSICMRCSLLLMPGIDASHNSDAVTKNYDRWLELSATMDLAELSGLSSAKTSGTGSRLSVEQSTASETTVSDETYLP